MLTKVWIRTPEIQEFKVLDADPSDILILTDISGLTSPKVNLYTGEFTREGGYYQGRRAINLTPVFQFKLNPNYTEDVEVSDIREFLYRNFMDPQGGTDAITITLFDDRLPARSLAVYVESIEIDHFSKERNATVSMVSVDPYLRSQEVEGWHPMGWTAVSVDYPGSADTGLQVNIELLSSTDQLVLETRTAGGGGGEVQLGPPPERMVLQGTFAKGDLVAINTVEGSRGIWVNDEDQMALLDFSNSWLRLRPGTQNLLVYGHEFGDTVAIIRSYVYVPKWWGI